MSPPPPIECPRPRLEDDPSPGGEPADGSAVDLPGELPGDEGAEPAPSSGKPGVMGVPGNAEGDGGVALAPVHHPHLDRGPFDGREVGKGTLRQIHEVGLGLLGRGRGRGRRGLESKPCDGAVVPASRTPHPRDGHARPPSEDGFAIGGGEGERTSITRNHETGSGQGFFAKLYAYPSHACASEDVNVITRHERGRA